VFGNGHSNQVLPRFEGFQIVGLDGDLTAGPLSTSAPRTRDLTGFLQVSDMKA
jgi:hypothetical protein